MKFRRRQLGASLIETMIAVGILGAIAYFVAGVIRNGITGQKSLQVHDDARTMTENMAAILSDQVACKQSLVLTSPAVDPSAGSAVTAIKDATGGVVYQVGNCYSAKSLRLESIRVGGPGTDAKTGIKQWTPLAGPPPTGTAFVQVTWMQVAGGGGPNCASAPAATESSGATRLTRFFLVNALSLDPTTGKTIASCAAVASGGGGGAGLWTKTGNDIFNQNANTGGVGIGLSSMTPAATLDVYAGGKHAIVVDSLGHVGIGTASPSADLHVKGSVGALILDGPVTAGGGPSVTWADKGTQYAQIVTMPDGANGGKLAFYSKADGGALGGPKLVISQNGNVGIGISGNTPAFPLEVNGDVQATSFISTSDERLKTDIHPVEGLAKVLQLRGTRFHWRKDGTPAIGLIAQEVEKVFPEIVSTNLVTGFKAVRYDALLGPVVEAIKELYGMCRAAFAASMENSRRLSDLEGRLSAKDALVRDLERRLDEQAKEIASIRARPETK